MKKTTIKLLAGISLCAMGATQALGQDSLAISDTKVIIVTVQKKAKDIPEVPISINAIGGHPTLQIDNFANTPNNLVFAIRGIGVIEPDPYAGNTVSIVVSGVPQRFSMGARLDSGASPRKELTCTGALKTYVDTCEIGKNVYRRFCPECGSPVLTDTDAAKEQGIVFLKAGTFDETSDPDSKMHCWTSSGQAWLSYPVEDVVMEKRERLG